MCRFQKISRPPPRRELEIPGSWGGGSEAQEIPERRGVGQSLSRGQYHFVFNLSSNIASYQSGRLFVGHK